MGKLNYLEKNKRHLVCVKLIAKIALISAAVAAILNGMYVGSGFLYERLVTNDASYIAFGIIYDGFRGFLIGLGVATSVVLAAKFWKAVSRGY